MSGRDVMPRIERIFLVQYCDKAGRKQEDVLSLFVIRMTLDSDVSGISRATSFVEKYLQRMRRAKISSDRTFPHLSSSCSSCFA